eukprot:TRINITY_DN9119_c0_g1_i1.p1 TRINITY_DN9119_c0_g1~~TRINITY_DN9119_c0_g1_i1.p1  ORF type:complete len:176 (+),score=45.76 TRINITY_DN9119_c0_g1_i1:58-528(+)
MNTLSFSRSQSMNKENSGARLAAKSAGPAKARAFGANLTNNGRAKANVTANAAPLKAKASLKAKSAFPEDIEYMPTAQAPPNKPALDLRVDSRGLRAKLPSAMPRTVRSRALTSQPTDASFAFDAAPLPDWPSVDDSLFAVDNFAVDEFGIDDDEF